MIYKSEINKLCEKLNCSWVKISETCGWQSAYLTANMKDHPDPLSMKVSTRIYHHFKKELKKMLPKQRIWFIEEYLKNANPRPKLTGRTKASKLMSKMKKKAGKLKGEAPVTLNKKKKQAKQKIKK